MVSACTEKPACSGSVRLTEPLRFSMEMLPSGGALVRSTVPLRLVTETSPATRSRVMLRLRVARVSGPRPGRRRGRRWG